ncbi:ATP-dependent DNA helicase [Helicobacter didelphidarum]|uniref:DNA 3'-5' helicase n=1 Tax=Helicobacter didelphidarum TaxID=2040648 RepID=A0A3D8IP32_9HELI|nr:UvrD-helicase domain-containing protein [Helicobacter didelphidarum]RDU66364.1 ATP-dependent DNA helicase [Helicobacter didelphidarum]
MNILDSLNDAQREAATYIDGALLILAGAGSGKTKTLTTRLTYLLCEVGVPPQNTLTLTFTNKAAKEMSERALQLIADSHLQIDTLPLLCTFHKFGLFFLRQHILLLNRSNLFSVIDEDDKKKILKKIKKQFPNILQSPSNLSHEISNYKNDYIATSDFINSLESDNPDFVEIYQQYEEYLLQNNLIDFDDLLLLPYRILQQNQQLREKISQKYQYIMVDEYQDTNNLQVGLLKMLCSTHENLCVVGDDDQSIYSWRGANIRNILEFDKEFSHVKIIKLEQNYRSTKQILNVANNLIAHNKERHDKILKAIRLEGNEVIYFENESDKEEMAKIIESIQKFIENGSKYEDIAILFRLNGLSRNVEECLNRAKIPFKMIGVIRFYERQEIKDCIAYLRLATNPNDNFSFERVINRPKRGIGDKTLQNILTLSKDYDGVYTAYSDGAFNNLKCKAKLDEFFDIIESLRDCILTDPAHIKNIFQKQIKLYHDNEKDIKNESNETESNEERRKNIDEFFTSFDEFIEERAYQDENILQDFLNDITLSSSNDDVGYNSVKCMSVHNSKGLEFKHVFVIGLEDGMFPLRSYEDMFTDRNNFNLAEERRLAYVAFTRAKDTLTLSWAKSRLYRKRSKNLEQSQFLQESGIIKEYKSRKRQAQISKNRYIPQGDSKILSQSMKGEQEKLKKGDCVQHKIFGFGRIESLQGDGENIRATINFGGTKRIILTSFLIKV